MLSKPDEVGSSVLSVGKVELSALTLLLVILLLTLSSFSFVLSILLLVDIIASLMSLILASILSR